LYAVVIGLSLLAGLAAGAGTQVVLGLAQVICPSLVAGREHVSIADGAHMLDRAALHRPGDLLGDGIGAGASS
jgi:hypothetical protein